ncbi:MAG: ATP-binding protein [Gammaproteobacteria bacterium]|nr:ATP-binding protein [Rhodocyclaceae bacterium]MBU3910352.1 ATP-binding protein [Gammaproteobacteria bacterium]MBU3988862.1 ATP-binding protein [Gammaproteobacteria bacterium]MBU4004179.1 ATP-binding protein [Gammaproteobacteria bacterium]MBU4020426.1 ATP-binding protein [Gammaproteobacteria bacterium]
MIPSYQRPETETLQERLRELPRFLIVVAGPRQVGKTTLVRGVLATYPPERYSFVAVDAPDDAFLASADPTSTTTRHQVAAPRDSAWLIDIWQRARTAAKGSGDGHILVLDEIQKIPRWSDTVKGLWDGDRAEGLALHVVLLGSSPLLMQQGMSESLTGRFEVIHLTHWSFREMVDAFDFDLEDYLYFGGYPGSAPLIRDEPRWRNYVNTGLIEPSIEKDILMMTRVDKPALLRQLFHLGCRYSGQELSYTKMMGQLQDAGNTVTLAHYLELLGNAGLIRGLQKYAGQHHRRRSSSPKLNVLNMALMSAGSGYTKAEAQADRSYRGRVVESAVGAHLHNTATSDCRLHYWRDGTNEVDFVLERGQRLVAIEVKSGAVPAQLHGLDAFEREFGTCRHLLIGHGGIPLAEFLSYPAEHWF